MAGKDKPRGNLIVELVIELTKDELLRAKAISSTLPDGTGESLRDGLI